MVLSTQYYREFGSSGNAKVCRLLINEGFIYEGYCEIRYCQRVPFRQSRIPGILLFDDRYCVGIQELVSPGGRVIVAIEPIGNLLIVPPLLTKTAYGLV